MKQQYVYGWKIVNRKDPSTGKLRPMKIRLEMGKEVEHHWLDKSIKPKILSQEEWDKRFYISSPEDGVELYVFDTKDVPGGIENARYEESPYEGTMVWRIVDDELDELFIDKLKLDDIDIEDPKFKEYLRKIIKVYD